MSTTSQAAPAQPSYVLSPETIKQSGLLVLSTAQVNRAVFVKNISTKASIKNVTDFFGFCGNVEKIVQDVDPNETGGKQFAVVVFENESAYSTALLLGQAIVVDTPITVYPYAKILHTAIPTTAVTQTITNTTTAQPQPTVQHETQENRSAVHVIASLTALGYVKGEQLIKDMKSQAQQLDSQTHLSQKAKLAFEVSRSKAQEIDNSLKLSQRLESLKNEAKVGVEMISKTLTDFDSKYAISQRANQAKDATLKTASDLANKALENETVKTTTTFVNNLVSTGFNSLKSAFFTLQEETKTEIQKQKGTPAAKKDATSTTTTTEETNDLFEVDVEDSFSSDQFDHAASTDLAPPPARIEVPIVAPQQTAPAANDLLNFEEAAPAQQPKKEADILNFE